MEASKPVEECPVVLDYQQLNDATADLSLSIEQAFGPHGLGIITIKNVPNFPRLRQNLLPLAARFAKLPEETKRRFEDPQSSYNVGWSCGKEVLEDGTPDTLKGSYYANPLCDTPTTEPELLSKFPSYTRPNVWPRDDLPELETAFKELGKLIYDVGLLLSRHCDAYVAQAGLGQPAASLRSVISRSPCNKVRNNSPQHILSMAVIIYTPTRKRVRFYYIQLIRVACVQGRLLCYLPAHTAATSSTKSRSWCGWHLDHGSLTGLTPAYYIANDDDACEVPCPDPEAGLYIKARGGKIVRVSVQRDHIAYQCGEALQVLSGGALQATPHCVVAPGPDHAQQLTRCTFALFMQPKWDEEMATPSGAAAGKVGVDAWAPGITFGEFSARKFSHYYGERV